MLGCSRVLRGTTASGPASPMRAMVGWSTMPPAARLGMLGNGMGPNPNDPPPIFFPRIFLDGILISTLGKAREFQAPMTALMGDLIADATDSAALRTLPMMLSIAPTMLFMAERTADTAASAPSPILSNTTLQAFNAAVKAPWANPDTQVASPLRAPFTELMTWSTLSSTAPNTLLVTD